jgi:hypothetical protein
MFQWPRPAGLPLATFCRRSRGLLNGFDKEISLLRNISF